MPIITKKDQIAALSKLKPEDKEDLNFCIHQLKTIVEGGVVSEDSIKTLTSIITMLLNTKEAHVSYVIMWLKHGFMEN